MENRTDKSGNHRQTTIPAATFCCCAGRTTTSGRCRAEHWISAKTLTDCAIREVREEIGLQIRITGLIGTYSDPHILIACSDGEVRQEFTFAYAAEIESDELKNDDESKEAGLAAPFICSRAATGRIATAQAERCYGPSEGATDVFEVTLAAPERFCALLLSGVEFYRLDI